MRNFLVVLATLLAGISAFGLSMIYGNHDVFARVILAAAFAVWFFVLWKTVLSDREHFIIICFALFNMFGIILPGLLQCADGHYPWFALSYPSDVVFYAAVILFIYSCVVPFGYFISYSRLRSRYAPTIRVPSNGFYIGGIFVFFLLTVIGIYALGSAYFFTSRRETYFLPIFLEKNSPTFSIAITIVRDFGFFGLALLVAAFADKRIHWALLIIPAAFAISGFFLANNPYNVARFNLFSFLIALLPLYFSTRKQFFKFAFVACYFGGILIAMPLANFMARGAVGSEITVDFFAIYRTTADFDGFQSIMNVILWVSDQGLRWGHELLSAILFFVPRDLWEAKAIGTGVAAATYMRYPMTNISSPLPIEFYADFGLVGMTLLLPFVGAILAWCDIKADRSTTARNHLSRLPYAVLAGYVAILIRGPLLAIIGPAVAAIALSFLIAHVFTKRTSGRTHKMVLANAKVLARNGSK
mgnify:CR=1 FL=1